MSKFYSCIIHHAVVVSRVCTVDMCSNGNDASSVCDGDVVLALSNRKYVHMNCLVLDIRGVVYMRRMALKILLVYDAL